MNPANSNHKGFDLVRFGRRPLIAIPPANLKVRAAAIECYPAHTWKKRLIRLLIAAADLSVLGRCLWTSTTSPVSNITASELEKWLEQIRRQLAGLEFYPVFVWPADAARGRIYFYLLSPEGHGLAFGKLALDEMNGRLIQNEQRALEQLQGVVLQKSRVPRLLAAGKLQDFPYLIVEAVPGEARITRWNQDAPIDELIREYAGPVQKIKISELENMSWWKKFTQSSIADSIFGQSVRKVETEEVDVCRIHGDLNQTNVLRLGNQVWLLDWERSCETGPCMTDAVCIEADRLWPLTRQNPGNGLAVFRKRLWDGSDDLKRSRILLALAFLCAANFPPALDIAQVWKEEGTGRLN